MDRTYQRVGSGVGVIHNPPRAKYSEETKNFVKLLMEESKLSMLHRKSIQRALNEGESLPLSRPNSNSNKYKFNELKANHPNLWKKRSQEMIIKSGAYEREQYRRTHPLPNKEKQKRQLACIMAYGQDMPETPRNPKLLQKMRKESEILDCDDPLEDLIRGIRERIEFLKEMEHLGEGKKYQPIMKQEIAQKLRMIESIDKQKSGELSKEIRELKYERPIPKPYPLGALDVNS